MMHPVCNIVGENTPKFKSWNFFPKNSQKQITNNVCSIELQNKKVLILKTLGGVIKI